MVIASLLASALLASAAVARPTLQDRIARRRGLVRTSQPRITLESTDAKSKGDQPEQSTNWSGIVYNSPKGTYKSVSASFIVPNPTATGDGSEDYYASSAWVGIDGDSCENAILQTGVDFNVEDGEVSYDAWYEWLPADAVDFDSSKISFQAGDEVKLSVTAHSTTTGVAEIENVTSGQKVSKNLSSSSALCQQDAEWIVEDFTQIAPDGTQSLVPLSNFNQIVFSNAVAGKEQGGSVGPADGIEIDLITPQGDVLTSVSTTSTSVTVTYTAGGDDGDDGGDGF